MRDHGNRHFIITRFNIASPGREVAIRNRPGWLERRFELFERYCLPSMAAQSCQDFAWIIYFDEKTPDAFRDRIARAQNARPFEARFVGPFSMSEVATDLAGELPRSTRILTTRLDNDDALSNKFVELVQAEARDLPADTVLNFPRGAALRDGKIYSAFDLSNPFATLVEDDAEHLKTVWGVPHHELGTKWRVVQVHSPPLWLQVVHSDNVANRIKGRRLPSAILETHFSLHPAVKAKDAGRSEVLLDALIFAPARAFREMAWKLVKPLVKNRKS